MNRRDPRWIDRLRAALDESALYRELTDADRAAVEARILEGEAEKVVRFGWVAVAMCALLLRVDAARIANGTFGTSWVWPSLAASHVMIGLSAVPGFALALRRWRGVGRVHAGLQRSAIGLVVTAVLAMGLLGVRYRHTGFELMLALISLNLVFHAHQRVRLPFTIGTTVAALLMLPSLDGHPTLDHLVLANEVLASAVAVGIMGQIGAVQRVRTAVLEQRLSTLAHVDALTGVASRRRAAAALEEALAGTGGRTRGGGAHTSLILIDLDHFKAVNDGHGHSTGDAFLVAAARRLQQRVRLQDVLGRWGGEEFVVVCPGTTLEEASILAEALRERLAAHPFEGIGHRTASFGVVEASPGEGPDAVLQRADAALYEAKAAGRNRVVVGR